jgi:hypothetical protein
MTWTTVGAVAAVLLTNPSVMTAQPVEPQRATIAVRTYNNFGVAVADLRIARVEAKAILGVAGIDVIWIECWSRDRKAAGASPSCGEPLGANDLVLRLQAGNAGIGTKFVSMGFSLIGTGPDRPFLSTIFPDVVQSVARGAAIDKRRVLGFCIAHEIGHLLLNTNSHAAAGVMRAGWSRNELHRNTASDWHFLEAEAANMRAAITTRGGGRNGI